MAALNAHELLEWLVQKQLLSAARALPLHVPVGAADGVSLAKELLQRNLLTPYQANQILQGKGDDLVLGAYRILERVGEGAMGQVFKAWQIKLERVVAIKMIHKEHLTSKKALERFFREMETAGQLEHPNIVRLRDAEIIDNRPFMVMDFVDGTDLARLVRTHGPLQLGQGADYARQTALGLQHAFERGVVHRDIKPGNLLITRDGAPVVKISDFGLARFDAERASQGRLTQYGAVLGTVDYIAPEQAANAQNADIRADIYSLGCTLYFLLAAKPPFPGSTIVDKISARVSGAPTEIRTYRPEVPAGLIAVLMKMMARRPDDRYQVPQEVAAALQPYCVKEALPLAVPVQPALAEVGGVPLARPVFASAGTPKDPFAFSSAEGDAPPPARPPALAAPANAQGKRGSVAFYALGGAGLVFLLVVLLLLRGCGRAVQLDSYPANASLGITLKENDRTLAPGDRKWVIFALKRTNFTGKVEVTLERIPEGVGPNPNRVVVDAKDDKGELPLFVSQFAQRTSSDLRVRAVAKNLSAEDHLHLTVRGAEPIEVPQSDK